MDTTIHTNGRKLPELLAPAGSPEALSAAISAGADAVYFGGAAFSNRMRARNFSSDELTEALQCTRRWGVRSYITINTRVRDGEMPEVLALAEKLLYDGADGFIVADMGIAAELHSRYPHAHLHGSTQMTLSNAADGELLAAHGFTRMVVPREISERELAKLVQDCPIEIEMFLHGAYCVSVSGQCLMSWAMGGRSGNRGECAQPCRMVYRVARGDMLSDRRRLPDPTSRDSADYPLSLKDMCLASKLPSLIDMGVASLKIEGRQKPAPYVYGVTKIYRTLLDERRVATPDEMAELDRLFSRGGFTDGYFCAGAKKNAYSHMGGIRPTTEEQSKDTQAEVVTKYDFSTRVTPCSGSFTLRPNEPATLTMTHENGKTVTVTGEVPQMATGNPITAEAVRKNLVKLGGTPFMWAEGKPELTVETGLWMPVSAVNALRRQAVERLEAVLHPDVTPTVGQPYTHIAHAVTAYPGADAPAIAVLTSRAQWCPEMDAFFETVFVPVDTFLAWEDRPANLGADLPLLCFDKDKLQGQIERLQQAGCTAVRFHSPGQLFLLRQTHMHTFGSFRLNVWNSDAMDWWYRAGAERITVSPEVTLGGIRALSTKGTPGGVLVYGHIPLMRTERCVLSATPMGKMDTKGKRPTNTILCGGLGGRMPDVSWREMGQNGNVQKDDTKCDATICGTGRHCGTCRGTLLDRTGTSFPMLAQNGETTIYNSLPLWMADKMDTLPPVTHREFLFTIEDRETVRQVLWDTESKTKRNGRRVK